METKPTSTVRLSVSIVLYHSPVDLLRSTLDSLYEASGVARNEAQLESVRVRLIDNSQSRTYANSVRDLVTPTRYDDFFTLETMDTTDNRGFGAGHNVGSANLTSNYHLILNPDVELGESALLTGLSALEKDSSITLVSPKVTGGAGEQEFLCKAYPSVLVLLLRAFAPAFICDYFRARLDSYELRDTCSGDQAVEILLASGCFMLLRSEAFAEVDGFNEKYFLYFEDFDLSLRLRGNGRLLFLPTMKIVHYGGYAASKGRGHIGFFIKSGVRFFNDHGWKWI